MNEVLVPNQQVFLTAPQEIRDQFNKAPFQFEHGLADNPLFELSRLAKLADNRIKEGKGGVKWSTSGVKIDSKWSNMSRTDQRQSIGEAIENLQTSGSWILLYSVQSDPEYGALLKRILSEIDSMLDFSLDEVMTWQDAYVFLASPRSVTVYHMDHEITFLFQIHGIRDASVWNARDRTLVTEQELENYYLGNLDAANYAPDKQCKAHEYVMAPGTGVHHPSCAPHAYRTRDQYSIALGIHFCVKSLDALARVYQINALLRRLKLRPSPPGQSAWKDGAKIQFLGCFAKRRPENKDELLRSGVRRLLSPVTAARTLVKTLRGS